jgi:hypothetical protein
MNRALGRRTLLTLAFLGVLVIYWLRGGLGLEANKEKWPIVPGTIVESSPNATLYRKLYQVRYKYNFNGHDYFGNWTYYLIAGADADRAAPQCAVGKSVSVWVRPDNPRESVLEPGHVSNKTAVCYIAIACTLVLFASALKPQPKCLSESSAH